MLRHRLTWWLDRAGVVDTVRRSRRSSDSVSILTFHRVAELPPDYPFDEGVVDATPAGFDEHLGWLAKHCNVIGLDVLRDAMTGGEPLPPNAVMLTFDDGYADNHAVALPILKKHALPATFFIATGFIEHRRLFWWDRVSYALGHARVDELRLSYPVALRFRLPEDASDVFTALALLIKELHGLDLARFLDHLDEAVGIGSDRERERALADELLMSWEQIRELHEAGMAVQSHTRWHRTIHTLDTSLLADELEGSRRDLETKLGAEIYALAYPVGKDVSKLDSVTEAIAAAGYELAFTNDTGQASLKRHRPLYVPRIAMELADPDWHLRALISLPGLSAGLR